MGNWMSLLIMVDGLSHLFFLNWTLNDLLCSLLWSFLWSFHLLRGLLFGFFIAGSFLLRLGCCLWFDGSLKIFWNISLCLFVGSSTRSWRGNSLSIGSCISSSCFGGLCGIGSSLISVSINWIWVCNTGFAPSIWLWKSSSGSSSFLLSPLDFLSLSARKKWIRISWNVGRMWKFVINISSVCLWSICLVFSEVWSIMRVKVPWVISDNIRKDLWVSLNSVLLLLLLLLLGNGHWGLRSWWISWIVASMRCLSKSSHVIPWNWLHIGISFKVAVPFSSSLLNESLMLLWEPLVLQRRVSSIFKDFLISGLLSIVVWLALFLVYWWLLRINRGLNRWSVVVSVSLLSQVLISVEVWILGLLEESELSRIFLLVGNLH